METIYSQLHVILEFMSDRLSRVAKALTRPSRGRLVVEHEAKTVVEPDELVLERLIRAAAAHETAVDITGLSKDALLARWANL